MSVKGRLEVLLLEPEAQRPTVLLELAAQGDRPAEGHRGVPRGVGVGYALEIAGPVGSALGREGGERRVRRQLAGHVELYVEQVRQGLGHLDDEVDEPLERPVVPVQPAEADLRRETRRRLIGRTISAQSTRPKSGLGRPQQGVVNFAR